MLSFVATKLQEFEQGKISRRKLIEVLTVAATSARAASAAQKTPAAQPGLKVALVNHISYTCPNFKQAGDWYSKVSTSIKLGSRITRSLCHSERRERNPTASPRRMCH